MIDLYISTRLRILNGRRNGDNNGKFTCQKPTGELLKEIIYFHGHPSKPMFSDCHCKISFNLKATYANNTPLNLLENMPAPFKWTNASPELSQAALTTPTITCKIESFLNNKFSSTAEHVDEAAKLFEDIIRSSGQLCLRRKKARGSKNQLENLYYEDLYVKRRTLTYAAQNLFNQPFNKIIRNTYFKHHREYRKLVTFKKKNL